jgi:hypothetical protein
MFPLLCCFFNVVSRGYKRDLMIRGKTSLIPALHVRASDEPLLYPHFRRRMLPPILFIYFLR